MTKSNKSNFKILNGTEGLIDWEIKTNDKDEMLIIDKMLSGGEILIAHDDFHEWSLICEIISNYLHEMDYE